MSNFDAHMEHQIIDTFLPFSPKKIILFGSFGSGMDDAESDVDLIIVYDTKKKFMDRLRELYSSWNIPIAVDILAYTPEEFDLMVKESDFIRQVTTEGEVLYERA